MRASVLLVAIRLLLSLCSPPPSRGRPVRQIAAQNEILSPEPPSRTRAKSLKHPIPWQPEWLRYPKNSRSKAAPADFSHGFSEYLPGELECGEHPSGVFAQWGELEDVTSFRDAEEFIRSEEKR